MSCLDLVCVVCLCNVFCYVVVALFIFVLGFVHCVVCVLMCCVDGVLLSVQCLDVVCFVSCFACALFDVGVHLCFNY